MGLAEKVAQIDKKFSWSFFGFVLAIIFGFIAVYTEFIRDTSPVVKYEILSNTRILDVKEDVSGLSIIYNAEDIKKAHKTLSVLVVRIVNEGRSPILKMYYDSASPLGLSINSGEIIKAEVITATTDYLRQNTDIRMIDSSNIQFSQIIIEPNESFTAKLLILNPEQSTLTMTPKGKIAGVKKILLSDLQVDQTKETFLMKVISGSLWVQVVRIVTYAIAFIILVIVIGIVLVVPQQYIYSKKAQRKRDKIIRQFKSQANPTINELNEKIYDFYRQEGLWTLKKIRKPLIDDNRFQNYVKTCCDPSVAEAIHHTDRLSIMDPAFGFKSMLGMGLISKNGETYTRNNEKIQALDEFIRFAIVNEKK